MFLAPGLLYRPAYLDRAAQLALRDALVEIIATAPLYTPRMPRSGKAFSVRMTNCGALGWVSDAQGGYRYQATHPETGLVWPPISAPPLRAWRELGQYPASPEACLVNVDGPDAAQMGLHQDRDELDLDAPVVSLSLGDSCVFRFGGSVRAAPTRSAETRIGRCAGPVRRVEACLSRGRPDRTGHLHFAARIRADQSDVAASDKAVSVPTGERAIVLRKRVRVAARRWPPCRSSLPNRVPVPCQNP